LKIPFKGFPARVGRFSEIIPRNATSLRTILRFFVERTMVLEYTLERGLVKSILVYSNVDSLVVLA
jgi:hypothetical protein